MTARDSARMLWRRTDLSPHDVDVAELYDGFSFLTLVWLEALGFCGKGESGPFVEGGERIAAAMGTTKLCILRNHGLLTGGASPGEAVGWFVTAERVAEVHVKAPEAKPISDEAAKEVERTLGSADMGWRVFQWLARDLVPDPSVVSG